MKKKDTNKAIQKQTIKKARIKVTKNNDLHAHNLNIYLETRQQQ